VDPRLVLDLLFPATCAGCRAGDTAFCGECAGLVTAPREQRAGELRVCAAGRYAGRLRRAILRYKRGRRDVGDALAALFAERLAPALPASAVIVPVPTVTARRRERGFDQSSRLARALGERSGNPVLLALRQAAGDAQRGRSRAARLAARGRFACTAPGLVAGVELVLVDDVMTTGSTLRDCAATLRSCGGCVRRAFVLAVA